MRAEATRSASRKSYLRLDHCIWQREGSMFPATAVFHAITHAAKLEQRLEVPGAR